MGEPIPNPAAARARPIEPAQPAHRPLVLVIEDEEPIRRFLRATLEANHYRVKEAGSAREGTLQAVTAYPDVILLDLGLPDGDGLAVTRVIRKESRTPIVVLSARGQESDKVAALDAGADDYLTKPFGVGELLARLRVALRHASSGGRGGSGSAQPSPYVCAIDGRTLRVDLAARLVHVSDAKAGSGAAQRREVRLTPMEFKLMAFLVQHAGKVLTHQMILKEVWGPQHVGDVQYLRVYAGELRKKLEIDPAQPRFLITEPGVGYRLMDQAQIEMPPEGLEPSPCSTQYPADQTNLAAKCGASEAAIRAWLVACPVPLSGPISVDIASMVQSTPPTKR